MKSLKDFKIGEIFQTGCSECEGGEDHIKLDENTIKCLWCGCIVKINQEKGEYK